MCAIHLLEPLTVDMFDGATFFKFAFTTVCTGVVESRKNLTGDVRGNTSNGEESVGDGGGGGGGVSQLFLVKGPL